MGRERSSISTLPDDPGVQRARRARLARRVGIAALVAFVALGVAGVFGVRTATVTASSGDYRLSVTYPEVSRPGLAIAWGFVVHRDGGFGTDPITIATTHRWLDLFDENGRNPAPSAEYVDGDMLVWEFDPPPGDTFTFTFDARLGPAIQDGLAATTELREGNVAVVEVSYRTRVMP